MKKYFLSCLTLIGLLQAQSLNHDYNMGRIVGGNYRFQTTLSEIDEDLFLLAPSLRHRFGVADRYQWDLDMTGFLQNVPDRLEFGIGVVRLGGIYKVDEGHLLNWQARNTNLALTGTGHSVVSGFNEKYERSLDAALEDHFLSRDGYIHLDSSQYQLAFLRGPLLNAGQYAHLLSGGYYYGNRSAETARASFQPRLGIASGLELQAMADLHLTDPNGKALWNNILQLGTEWRLQSFFLAASLQHDNLNTWKEAQQLEDYIYTGQAGIVLGGRKLSFAQVEGNYDRFFSPLLGAAQVYLSHQSRTYTWNEERRFDFTSSAQAGLSDRITLGISHHLLTDGGDHSLSLSGIYSNVTPRTSGPSDVADMEYLWGYLMQPGEWRVETRWRTPLLNPEQRVRGIIAPLWRNQQLGAPHMESFVGQPYFIEDSDIRISLHLGMSERLYGKIQYDYFAHGLTVPGDLETPYWRGRAHAASAALGYMRFDAIWEAGLQIQMGEDEANGNSRNTFPIYIRSAARF